MRKKFRAAALLLVFIFTFSSIWGTAAMAEEVDQTGLTLNDFGTLQTIELNSRTVYEIGIGNSDLTVSAASGDESIIKVFLQRKQDDPGVYEMVLEGWKEGKSDITLKASDGTSETRSIEVVNTDSLPAFTISADAGENFTIPTGSSRSVKIHYESQNYNAVTYPTLVADNQSDFRVELMGVDYDSGDYYYRVDAVGKDGGTCDLYMGSSDCIIPQKLCGVTIAENQNLRLDTASTYVCNVYDTYSFAVYTSSPTAPEVSAVNDLVTVEYTQKVPGGYLYTMEAEEEGNSLVQVAGSGETAAFAVKVNYNDPPSVSSDTPAKISLAQGKSYTYKFTIMGGGAPKFAAAANGVLSVQTVKKDGVNYYCKVTAIGDPGSNSDLLVTFPDTGDESFTVDAGNIAVTQPEGIQMTSDTNSDFSLNLGSGYTFRISGAASFYAGTSGIFQITNVGKSGIYTFYHIKAVGRPGQSTGLYMSAPGQDPKKVCAVTIKPITLTSDTNRDFQIYRSAHYMFKISAPGASSVKFTTGNGAVVSAVPVSRSGNDFYFRITAVGTPGQQTGIYAYLPGQAPQKLCVVTIKPVVITSDTTSDFSVARNAAYTFKVTAPGAPSLNFVFGTGGVYQTVSVVHTGNDFFYKIRAVGAVGQSSGIYATVPGQVPQKLCVASVK